MMLTDLADACRKSGLKVVEVDGWKSRHTGTLKALKFIMWHHTATPARAKGDYPTLKVVRDGRSDVSGPLSQLGLGRSGTVYVVAAGRANHAGKGSWPGLAGSSESIGIEMESPGDGTWTKAQLLAMPLLRDALMQHYGLSMDRNIAHREWAPTRKIDPKGISIRSMVSGTSSAFSTNGALMALSSREQADLLILARQARDLGRENRALLQSATSQLNALTSATSAMPRAVMAITPTQIEASRQWQVANKEGHPGVTLGSLLLQATDTLSKVDLGALTGADDAFEVSALTLQETLVAALVKAGIAAGTAAVIAAEVVQ